MDAYRNKKFTVLEKLIDEGSNYDLDLTAIAERIKSYINSQQNGTIKIVLLGSFSDGKTTAIAGLLEKVESNMKIDEDESSDDLTIYHADVFGQKYEIVDTPGLFGTKEREIDGRMVKFSEITEKYISEAHIIIYVCNSVNTLKDSHKEIIKRVLRDYNKLDSTIFVINRMDEVADTDDEEEYAEVSSIKIATFKNRLKQIIGLTPDEEKVLNIACIAANPNAKGLSEWLKDKAEYIRHSHISQLENCVTNVINKSDVAQIKSNTDSAVIKDVVLAVSLSIASKIYQLQSAISKINSSLQDMENDLAIIKSSLIESRRIMRERIKDLRNGLLSTVTNIGSLSEMGTFIETELGIECKQLDFNVLMGDIRQIMSECAETNSVSIDPKVTKFEKELDAQNILINDFVKGGLAGMKKVNGKMVLKARDIFFKGHKFKPYGAIKFAKKIGAAAAVLGILFDGYVWYKKHRDNKKLEEFKADLKDSINDIFKKINKMFDEDDVYYKNFAPSYLELVDAVKTRRNQTELLQKNTDSLNTYKSKFRDWYGEDIEDAIFEEIK